VKYNFSCFDQNPQSRIDELLFQEATTKISAPNLKYNGSIDQNGEVRFFLILYGKLKSCNILASS
jgi:hypothetical protein